MTPELQAILVEISSLLAGVSTPGLTSASASGDVFEAFVFALLVSAAEEEGYGVDYQDNTNQPTSTVLFRTSPGTIYRSSPDTPLYTHAVLNHADVDPLEAHIGIKVTGKSGVEHECDVALLRQDVGWYCRQRHVHPRSSDLLVAVECKYYTKGLPLNLGRAFVGLVNDLASRYGRVCLAISSSSNSVTTMLEHQKRHWFDHLRPDSSTLSLLVNTFRLALRDYRVRER